MKCPNNTYLYFEQLISMEKIALLIIYNHRYDKNIPILDKIYEGRFSYVYHVVPFYDGDRENVIAVYENSYYFQGYIAQAYQHLKGKGFTHYFIIADDMVINPILTEKNLFKKTGIGVGACYIYDIREIFDCFVAQHTRSMKDFCLKKKGVEIESILPTKYEAEQRFCKHELRVGALSRQYLLKSAYYALKGKMLRKSLLFVKDYIVNNVEIKYPLVWGYSDILLLTADVMGKFATYCGAFAADELFVEYAIPTSLIFSADNIVTDKMVKLHGVTQIYSRNRLKEITKSNAFIGHQPLYWEAEQVNEKYQTRLDYLLGHFPSDIFFIHPIKLSKWK